MDNNQEVAPPASHKSKSGGSSNFAEQLEPAPPPNPLTVKLLLTCAACFGALPLRLRQAIGRILGRIVAPFLLTERRFAIAQLKRFIPERPSVSTYNAMCASLGQTLAEALNLDPLLTDERIEIEQPELFKHLRATNRPILALTAHTSNWELLAAFASQHGFSVAAVGRMARDSVIQQLLAALRLRSGVRTLWRSGRSNLKEIISILQNPGVLAALIDQDTRVASMIVPFFGVPARTPSSLVELAIKHQAEIVVTLIFRTKPNHYKVFLHKLDSSEGTAAVLTNYSKILEHYLRQYPEQWVWFHKRWRVDQSGKRRSSEEYMEWLSTGGQ